MKTGSQVLDSICISEAEKQAVLSLIREEVDSLRSFLASPQGCFDFTSVNVSLQIITKEVEVSDWKVKFEASRQEVGEMR